MSSIKVLLGKQCHCEIEHLPTEGRAVTDVSTEYGGLGKSFSPAGLMVSALGACMASSMGYVARMQGQELEGLSLTLDYTTAERPKRIATIDITIRFGAFLDPELRELVLMIAESCPVRNSLHPDIAVRIHS